VTSRCNVIHYVKKPSKAEEEVIHSNLPLFLLSCVAGYPFR
jgi:hypothetical protein